MFDAKDHRWGMVAERRQGGRLTVTRVTWQAFRWTMIQFAKFVLVEFEVSAPGEQVEAVVEAWLARR